MEKQDQYFDATQERQREIVAAGEMFSTKESAQDQYLDNVTNLGANDPSNSGERKMVSQQLHPEAQRQDEYVAKIMGTESYNGWTYWYCNIKGNSVSIDNLRQRLISKNN